MLPWHFISQKRYSECEKKTPWVVHLIMMLSYLSMSLITSLLMNIYNSRVRLVER